MGSKDYYLYQIYQNIGIRIIILQIDNREL